MTLLGLLSGCGAMRAAGSAPSANTVPQAPVAAMAWVSEPQAGFAPWHALLRQATTEVEVNAYLLTDSSYVASLRQLAARGISVRVILAPNPYHDAAAVHQEKARFAGSRVQLHWAPARFDRAYATDHAKYLIVNPGTPQAQAIVGSPNGTWSAFGGANAEDAIATTSPAVITALARVFQADWTGHRAGPKPRQTLLLSPGAESTLVTLLAGSGPVAVMTEELGDVPALYRALARHGSQARMLVPSSLLTSPAAQTEVATLLQAGIHVRTLTTPYVHGKLLITATQTWVGSQNWSEPSLQKNREVGILTANASIHTQALTWFHSLWAQARPWMRP